MLKNVSIKGPVDTAARAAAAMLLMAMFAAPALTGCLREHPSGCPVRSSNVDIDFALDGGGGFAGRVSSVDVGIFDGEGVYLRTERVGAAALAAYAGINLSLVPGDYRLVFWANLDAATKIDNRGAYWEWRLVHADGLFDAGGVCVTGRADPLWYAPCGAAVRGNAARVGATPQSYYPLTVTAAAGPQRHAVGFVHAYRTLDIYVEGLPDDDAPLVEVSGLPAGLSYSGARAIGTTVTHLQQTSPVEKLGRRYAAASFRTFRFDDARGIDIAVRGADGEKLYSIPLTEALAAGGGDTAQVSIEFVIGFRSGTASVSISIPDWAADDVYAE